ncbi:MAG TPA: 3-hydroxyacyl-CoA dehydrogenase NAD-binding domain-containing protein [Dongiaceae bacterium]|nr:3-hydroxyacyl-CoA dehydrogenase NAD-binding domain-containing protein [Dongiaceae bacterium]
MEIRRAAVIGAGVMGSGIAAHIANAGLPVDLLDVPAREGPRDAIAAGAIERLLKTDPAPLMSRDNARLIRPGNIEDDLDRLKEVDWIVEAVVEKLEIKHSLYAKLAGVVKPGAILSSNTSTISRRRLVEGMPEDLARRFAITHFFNPPRYLRLLEIVPPPADKTSGVHGQSIQALADFADHRLGKSVVWCKDTPGFIANRIGAFWIQSAAIGAVDGGLTVEEADAVMGRPLGIPKTGIFGLLDLVGLDLQPHVDASLAAQLPKDDPYQPLRRDWPLFDKMIAEGYTGRKGKGGFYRLLRDGAGKELQAIDLKTGAYRAKQEARLESVAAAKAGLKALVEHPDKGGRYAWQVLAGLLSYAARVAPEIADDIAAIDGAMRNGYNWKYGPFQLIDRMGARYFADRLAAEKKPVPPLLAKAVEAGGFYREREGRLEQLGFDGSWRAIERPAGVLLLSDIKRASKALAATGSASLWDLGDGVACLEFHSKMNSLDPDSLQLLRQSLDLVAKRKMKALVIHNEGDNFSVGLNLGLALFSANLALWPMIEDMVQTGQQTYKAVKYAPFPVVGAPSGMALGGGCEILLHCAAIVAHAESYIGLVEAGVGIVPGWGGCKELLARATAHPKGHGPMPPVAQAFETISTAKVARSAFEAKELGFLGAKDEIVMNRDRLLAAAKAKVLALADGYQPPAPASFRLPGPSGKTALMLAVDNFVRLGKATAYDRVVAEGLADVLTGGPAADPLDPLPEDKISQLERQWVMHLLRQPKTLARMEHTLATGKPLRN